MSGLVAFFVGSRRGDRRTRRDGTIALAYVAIAILLSFVGAAVGD